MAAYMVFNYRITDQEAYKPYLGEVGKTLKAHDDVKSSEAVQIERQLTARSGR